MLDIGELNNSVILFKEVATSQTNILQHIFNSTYLTTHASQTSCFALEIVTSTLGN